MQPRPNVECVLTGALSADNGRCWPRRCNWIRMTMNKFTAAMLQAKHAGRTQGQRKKFFATADLRSAVFHFDNACEIVSDIALDEVDAGHLSLTVVRGSAG